jgi:predicted nuclease of predicted toxin-antitoxin system
VAKLLFDESLSPKLVTRLRDSFPGSESALLNGLAQKGDRRVLEYAANGGFILVTTDADFEQLVERVANSRIVILRRCDYPTSVAIDIIQRHARQIREFAHSRSRVLIFERN